MALPRHRVDCATWAIMGMGMGSAVGAAVATGKSVVAIEGDSAGHGAHFNNGGIYNNMGVNPSTDPAIEKDPAPTTLDLAARYDKMGEVFGAKNYYVTTPAELTAALTEAIVSKAPANNDVQLAGDAGKESGHIGYLNPTPLIQYTV